MTRQILTLTALLVVATMTAGATDYFVAPTGSDENAGTTTRRPFRTLARAASALQSGDTCYLRAGVYRETLVVKNSGTTFTPYKEEAVVISGADPLGKWKRYKGNIWQRSLDWDLGAGLNQLFVDGVMMVPARWPNLAGADLLHPKLVTAGVSSNTVESAQFARVANYWQGGMVVGGLAERWAWQFARIESSTEDGVLRVTNQSNPWFTDRPKRKSWLNEGGAYITGLLKLLDEPRKYHIERQAIYLWPPDGKDPSRRLVELKRRPWCVDFNGQSNVVVRGVKLFAGSVRMAGNHCTLENCEVQYPSHYAFFLWHGYANAGGVEQGHSGVWVKGDDNVIRGCNIGWSAGSGIVLEGARNLITRCVIHDTDYAGTYACAIAFRRGGGNRIWFNTISNSGRDMLHLEGANADDIRYNDISGAGLLCNDVGLLYMHGVDGHGTRIAYNWLHDNVAPWKVRPGVYLDNFCRNFIVDHNVIWNCREDAGVRINGPAENHQITHNTLFDCKDVGANTYSVWPPPAGFQAAWPTNVFEFASTNNLYLGTNAVSQLVDPEHRDFRRKPDAPNPTFGAYEPGGFYWKAGADGVGE